MYYLEKIPTTRNCVFGVYWMEKISLYKTILVCSLEGVKDVIDAGCYDFLTFAVLVNPVFKWNIFIDR